jgi:tetratricopeptide (TPR) repeat protein
MREGKFILNILLILSSALIHAGTYSPPKPKLNIESNKAKALAIYADIYSEYQKKKHITYEQEKDLIKVLELTPNSTETIKLLETKSRNIVALLEITKEYLKIPKIAKNTPENMRLTLLAYKILISVGEKPKANKLIFNSIKYNIEKEKLTKDRISLLRKCIGYLIINIEDEFDWQQLSDLFDHNIQKMSKDYILLLQVARFYTLYSKEQTADHFIFMDSPKLKSKNKAIHIFDTVIKSLEHKQSIVSKIILDQLIYLSTKLNKENQIEKLIRNNFKYNKNDSQTYLALVNLYVNTERYKEAISILYKLAKEHPLAADFYLASIYKISAKINDYELLQQYLQELLDEDPMDFNVSYKLAQIYFEQKQYKKAIKYLSTDKTNTDNLFLLSIAHLNLKQYNLAYLNIIGLVCISIDNGRQINKRELYLYYEIANKMDLKDDKKLIIDKILETYQEDPEALNFVAYYMATNKETLDKAYELIKKALNRRPKNLAFLDTLMWIYHQTGNNVFAQKVMNKILFISEDKDIQIDGEIYEHFGDICLRLNKFDKAVEYWKMAIESTNMNLNRDKIKIKINKIKQ